MTRPCVHNVVLANESGRAEICRRHEGGIGSSHEHVANSRPRRPVRAAAVAAPRGHPATASECVGCGHGEGGGAAGFPVVATTSAGVAATLGYEDEERAPRRRDARRRCADREGCRGARDGRREAGYGREPAELVSALRSVGAAGCNLEDTDHAAGALRDPVRHAEWLRAVRSAASEVSYPLVINARDHVFLGPLLAGSGPGTQGGLVPDALRRASAYLEAGVDCVYPIGLWETGARRRFTTEVRGPVNVVRLPQTPALADLAALGVARVSWGPFLHLGAIAHFEEQLAALQE